MTDHISTLIEESQEDSEAALQLAQELHQWVDYANQIGDFGDLDSSAHLQDTVEEILHNAPDEVAEKFDQLRES
jgi:hypothetical protein